MKKYLCECIGTAVLVLFGCGSAALSGGVLGILGIALAFGLSIVAMAYVIGNISGCHINPAVSLAMLINKKLTVKDFIGYVIAQVIGAVIGIGILYGIIACSGLDVAVTGLGANGFGELSPINLNMLGLTLAFVHIMGIQLTGTSVNPARSLAPALFLGGEALKQVWVFILAPLVGSAIAAFTFKFLNKEENK